MTEELHDSGYTQKQIDTIWRSLTKGQSISVEDGFFYGMMIGLWDGCLMQEGGRDTNMLQTPRVELDRRIAAVRAAIASGATLEQAVAKLEPKHE